MLPVKREEESWWESLTPNQQMAFTGASALALVLGVFIFYQKMSSDLVLVSTPELAIAKAQTYMISPAWQGRPKTEYHSWTATASPLGGYNVTARHPFLGLIELAVTPEGEVSLVSGVLIKF